MGQSFCSISYSNGACAVSVDKKLLLGEQKNTSPGEIKNKNFRLPTSLFFVFQRIKKQLFPFIFMYNKILNCKKFQIVISSNNLKKILL